jgi:hypothetical protein
VVRGSCYHFGNRSGECLGTHDAHYVVTLQSCTVTCSMCQGHTTASTVHVEFQKNQARKKICWPHLRVRSLSKGGPGGHCRYPAERVPPYTSFKSRQRVGRASTCCHMPCSTRPCLPTKLGSGAAMCPWLRTPPPYWGGLRCHRMSYSSGPCLLVGRVLALPHILRSPVGHGSQA